MRGLRAGGCIGCASPPSDSPTPVRSCTAGWPVWPCPLAHQCAHRTWRSSAACYRPQPLANTAHRSTLSTPYTTWPYRLGSQLRRCTGSSGAAWGPQRRRCPPWPRAQPPTLHHRGARVLCNQGQALGQNMPRGRGVQGAGARKSLWGFAHGGNHSGDMPTGGTHGRQGASRHNMQSYTRQGNYSGDMPTGPHKRGEGGEQACTHLCEERPWSPCSLCRPHGPAHAAVPWWAGVLLSQASHHSPLALELHQPRARWWRWRPCWRPRCGSAQPSDPPAPKFGGEEERPAYQRLLRPGLLTVELAAGAHCLGVVVPGTAGVAPGLIVGGVHLLVRVRRAALC